MKIYKGDLIRSAMYINRSIATMQNEMETASEIHKALLKVSIERDEEVLRNLNEIIKSTAKRIEVV